MTLTANKQTKEEYKPLDFVTVQKNNDVILSGKQASLECNAIPLETFISELHRRVHNHFATVKK